MAARYLDKKANDHSKQIDSFLTSSNPHEVMSGLRLLKSAGTTEKWRVAVTRSTAYSICTLLRNSELVERFVEAMEKDFSQVSTRRLMAACESAIKAMEPEKNFGVYDRYSLCRHLAPFGLEVLSPTSKAMPSVTRDNAPFAAAGVAKCLGQILWRDLALKDRLKLLYLPDSIDGDRLMPDHTWRLLDEKESASNSLGCEFICGPAESYFLPWIKKHYFIDPNEIRRDLYRNYFYERPLEEYLEPRFTEEGLVHAALEGLCDDHLVLLDEAKFDRKIEKEFKDVDEMLTVRVEVLDRPVDRKAPKACFSRLRSDKKAWLADFLIHAARGTLCPEIAALSKHVLGWMTLHPATPSALRARLAKLGFGVTQQPFKKAARKRSGNRFNKSDRRKSLGRSRVTRLQRLVNAWERICDDEGVDDLGREGFLAAHYAKLALANEVSLTKAGWKFIDDVEELIVDE